MVLMKGEYNFWIMLLSFVIAVVSSYSALSITSKIWSSKATVQLYWIGAGALVMGTGIWSMHFVGMIAFHLGISVNYNYLETFLSLLASITAAFIAFYLTSLVAINRLKIVLGGLVMGGGITAMHYIGMSSMRIPGVTISYDRSLTYWSFVIAVLASYAALLLCLRFRRRTDEMRLLKWAAALLMGIAVCGMHYVGMKATLFRAVDATLMVLHLEMETNMMLLIAVSLSMMIIVLITWSALLFDFKLLRRMAYTDPLTGLPNRHDMNRCFDNYLSGYQESAVFFLDLDQFKSINDTLGHDIGDMLVQEVADRIKKLCSSKQKVFRLGGDEFLLLAAGMNREQAEEFAAVVLEEIRKPYLLDGNELYVTGSVGISLSPLHGLGRSELLRLADTAMYHAKNAGKNAYSVFNEQLDQQLIRRMSLEKDMRRALKGEEFVVHYQPKWNVKTGTPIGLEALIRWNHPEMGLISPAELIPIAEETGFIVSLTKWVMLQACQECVALKKSGVSDRPLSVSVNLSVRVFESGFLYDMVEDALSETGLPAELLELEITESIVMHDINNVIRQLIQLRELGVQISMDDFGAGYSSLGALDRLPIDTLKIDRHFIMESNKPSKRAIIHTIITLAKQLDLELVAEGVEEESHIEFLRKAGCNVMQGYYYGTPMNQIEIRDWLHALRPALTADRKQIAVI